MRDPSSYWVLFDGDCRICAAAARWVAALDPSGRIRIRAIQASGDLLASVPAARLLSAYHVVAPDGRVTTGGDAVPTLVEAFPLGAGLSRIVRRSPDLMAAVHRLYAFSAKFRDVLICRVDAGPSPPSPSP